MTVSVTRQDIVDCARTWIGTPFHHQGRAKGAGVDCAGLVIGVAHELGLSDFDVTGYAHQPDEAMFRRVLDAQMDRVAREDLLPGDVLTFAYEREQHLAILTTAAPAAIVHAWAKARRVVEHGLDDAFSARLRGCWRFRGL